MPKPLSLITQLERTMESRRKRGETAVERVEPVSDAWLRELPKPGELSSPVACRKISP